MIASQEPEKWLRECLPRPDGRQVAMDYDAKAATNFIEVATYAHSGTSRTFQWNESQNDEKSMPTWRIWVNFSRIRQSYK